MVVWLNGSVKQNWAGKPAIAELSLAAQHHLKPLGSQVLGGVTTAQQLSLGGIVSVAMSSEGWCTSPYGCGLNEAEGYFKASAGKRSEGPPQGWEQT